MAKELIATLITNDNGEAFYTYTGTGAGEITFTAESGDLESEPLVINDMSEELTLTSDKNILSYADNDTVTLTATYDGTTIEGKSVVFKLGDRVLATETTDSEGIAEYEYSSQGIGDIVFTAECGELVETITIEDCTRYDTIEYTTRQDVQWAMPTGDFEVSADFYHTSNWDSFPQLYIGTELNVNNIAYGKIHNNKYGAEFKKNGSRLTMIETNADLSNNTYHTIKLTRIGDLYTVICDNGETLTYSNNTILPTYLFIIYVPQSKIKNIKIKPLPFDGSMSVSASKNILSYADEESCTLTAALTGNNISNRPVIFKKGDIVLDTVNTDSNGIAACTYNSQGVGDVTITAECMNLQETYSICDAKWYNTLTDSSADSHLIKTGVTCSYTSNGLSVTNGNWKEIVFDTQITQGTIIEYDITSVGGNYTPKYYSGFFDTYSQGNAGITNYHISTTGHVKIVYQNNTVQMWIDDVLQNDIDSSTTNPTVTTTPLYYKVSTGSDRTFIIKNIKIKPLSFETHNSNTEQDEDTPLPTILYSNDGTTTDLQRPEGGTCTTSGEHLILGDAYKKRFMLPITLNGDWEFSFNIITRIGSAFNLIVDNVEIEDGNSYDAGTVIKLVCEQGTVKEYVNDTLKNSNTISSSNYSIGIKPIVNSFYLDNLQVKQLEE